MSDLPWTTGDDPATRNGAKGRPCKHLKWQRTYVTRREWSCQCGHAPDSVKVRAGGNARSRGLAIQREIARSLGLVNLQGNGPTDARSEEVYGNAAFVCQVKSGARFPGWMATELAKLPTTGGRIPILAIAETPGPGHGKRRAVIVVEIGDWIDLHGGAK